MSTDRSSLADALRRSTAGLAREFQKRIDGLRNRPDILSCLRPLGTGSVLNLEEVLPEPCMAVGIDGSMDYDEVLEMLLFYVTSSAYQCPFSIQEGKIAFDWFNISRTPKLSASAAVPLWKEDLSSVAHTGSPAENKSELRNVMERIPFALMAMSELYLAWKLVFSNNVRILFLDRPLSTTYSSLYNEAAILMRGVDTVLAGQNTTEGKVEEGDIYIGALVGSGVIYVPPRGSYLPHAVLKALIACPNMTAKKEELKQKMGWSEDDYKFAKHRLEILNGHSHGQIIEKASAEEICIARRAASSWRRVRALAIETADRIFNPPLTNEHPLKTVDGKWLRVIELNVLNLFLLEALIEEAMKRRVFLIGTAKDTTATDFTRAAVPTSFMLSSTQPPDLSNLKSDKALLTILSTVNASRLPTPWRTFGYDSCMMTLVVHPQAKEEKERMKAARRTILRERLFVRGYFQLRTFQSDPEIRAPVFLYERLFQPEWDEQFVHFRVATEWKKAVRLSFYLEDQDRWNRLDDVMLRILAASDNPEVLEAYGHNQLLYLADKFVKREVQLMKGTLKGVVDLELTPLARKEKIFWIARRFRDLRAQSEAARRQSVELPRGE